MRIFVAVTLPKDIKKYIGEYTERIKDAISGVKWEIPEKLHITLKFIGNIDQGILDNIGKALSNYNYNEKSVKMKIIGINGFPNLKKPSVIVIMLEPNFILDEIRNYVENTLLNVGIEKDTRNFIPHVTIGRVKSKIGFNKDLPVIDSRDFNLVSLDVVKSVLSKNGSEYFTCFTFNFR